MQISATEKISPRDARSLEYVSDVYAVRSVLGRGASSTVYLAEDLDDGRQVVIKLLNDRAQSKADAALSRFRDEVTATRKLEHKNIMRILDHGVTDDHRPFLVTEFVEGRSLAAVLRESGPLETEDAINAGFAIAEALAYVHSQGFVHRDVKPSNVLIPRWPDWPDFKNAKLLDFGVAGRLEDSGHTQAGMIYGTLRYMSPEQVKGEQQSAATDVYGFGLLLYEMLAGSAPVKREQDLTTLLIAIRDGISEEDLRRVQPELADLIRRCVRTDPAERPSMSAVLAELTVLLRGTGAEAKPMSVSIAPVSAPEPVMPQPALPGSSAQPLTETTLALNAGPQAEPSAPPRTPGEVRVASGTRPWVSWTVLAFTAAIMAIAAIVYFRPAAPVDTPSQNISKEQPSGTPSAAGAAMNASNDTVIRRVRFAAGLLLMGASVFIGFSLRNWLGRQSQVKSQAYDLVFGARARTDLTATIAVQLDDLVSKLSKLDERILAGSVALMLNEYGSATDTKDRQAALMNVVALSEKLAVRLSPWYERYKEVIASAVAVMGGVSGLMTAINSVLSHKH